MVLSLKRKPGTRELKELHRRNARGVRLLERPEARRPRPQPDFEALAGSDGLPEFSASALTPELLAAGISRHGCLLVRGLVDRPGAEQFARQIERAFGERERHDSGAEHDPAYYSPFEADPRRGERVGPLPREWIKLGGGLLAADSPLLSDEMFRLFAAAGLPELAAAYLGEPALISVDKTTLRRADPSVGGAWHQDGKFMGEVNSLNVWLALSRCGDEAPGLDIVPRRIDHHLVVETDEATLPNMISQRVAEEAALETPILRPIFQPGDALLFDELFVHKTASDPAMPKPRYAIENWFFGPSTFPVEYAPIAV